MEDPISIARRWVRTHHPEMREVSPSAEKKGANTIVTFKKALTTADGTPLQRVIRLTVDGQGQISKVSISKG
ncbi:MAG: hypothetical protein HYU86_11680 [Chloroflexi bacterium]|nr:hypothetical protein [Chloroflexota bacterium]